MLYVCNIMIPIMKQTTKRTKRFDTKRSIEKSMERDSAHKRSILIVDEKKYVWFDKMERIQIIREGIPYTSVEVIGKKLNKPLKAMFRIMNIPQTTYNKKKKEGALLDHHDSELILLIDELIEYGKEVFNQEEEKFQRWLIKPNHSLGGHSPDSLLDTITGINEVTSCLNRIEYGSFA